jgi:hypothetical protein
VPDADSRRAADQARLGRAALFSVAVLATSFSLNGVIAQHAAAAGIGVAVGLLFLAAWWLMRPRYASARSRRLGTLCSLLTIAVTTAAVLSLALFLDSPADGIFASPVVAATPATLRPTIIAAAAAVVLLAARVAAGRRLKKLTVAVAAGQAAQRAEEAASRQPDAARLRPEAGPGRSLPGTRAEPDEISAWQERWRTGEFQPTQSLARRPDGTLVLRPALRHGRVKSRRAAAGVSIPALIVIAGSELTRLGVTGVIIAAIFVAGLLGPVFGVYELRHRLGIARLTPATVIVPTWYGRRRALARAQIQRAVLVEPEPSLGARSGQAAGKPGELWLLLLAPDGRCLRRVRAISLSVPASDVLAFAAALQVPVQAANQQPTAQAELSRDYPGSVSWVAFHPKLVVLQAILVMIMLLAIPAGVVAGLFAAGVLHLGAQP